MDLTEKLLKAKEDLERLEEEDRLRDILFDTIKGRLKDYDKEDLIKLIMDKIELRELKEFVGL